MHIKEKHQQHSAITAGEIVDNVADKLGIYGACQSDKGKGCSKDTCNCRSGFVTVLQSEIESLMDSQLKELREENKKLREGLALNQGDVARKKMLLEELGQAVSDEIVDKENGNYLKLKVDDIPEDFIWYMD